jgi:hypothetical protein
VGDGDGASAPAFEPTPSAAGLGRDTGAVAASGMDSRESAQLETSNRTLTANGLAIRRRPANEWHTWAQQDFTLLGVSNGCARRCDAAAQSDGGADEGGAIETKFRPAYLAVYRARSAMSSKRSASPDSPFSQ